MRSLARRIGGVPVERPSGRAITGDTNSWYPPYVGRNTSFSLDDHHRAFIEQEVASGRYRSASDVVRSALRLLEDRETQLRALRQALVTGEQSGESRPFDFDAFVSRKRGGNPRRR
jgi:antitoxin ParD1/3/4